MEFEYLLNGRTDEHGQLCRWRKRKKARFCNFIYSNPKGVIRDGFCRQLMKYKPVACPGKSLNNMPPLPLYGSPQGASAKVEFMSDFRFSICFENQSADHYLTEKILHAFCAGSIPIYWGCPQVAEYYNPASFVNCHDYDSFDEVIDKVREIDADPKLYQQYLEAPPILPGSRFHSRKEELRLRAEEMVEEALRRRQEKVSYLQDMSYKSAYFARYGFLWWKNWVFPEMKYLAQKVISRIKRQAS